jgi:hypothetical protein
MSIKKRNANMGIIIPKAIEKSWLVKYRILGAIATVNSKFNPIGIDL